MEYKRMTLRVTNELNVVLLKLSKERGLTLNALIIQILWEYLNPKK